MGGPRLAVTVSEVEPGRLVLGDGSDRFDIDCATSDAGTVREFLQRLDGQTSVADLASRVGMPLARAKALIDQLQACDLLDFEVDADARSGGAVLLELEDLVTGLLYDTLYQNPYWRAMQNPTADVPEMVLHGTIVENYHFLFRESWFDAPALCYPYSRRLRVAMIDFFVEENAHDELILRSLNALGHSREDLADTIPLQTTAALCNSLAWWSRSDPLFFVTTVGVLEGRDLSVDSFVRACDLRGVAADVVGPMRKHSEINMAGGHGSVSREAFAGIQAISPATVARLASRSRLFVQLYDDFYRGIWDHYSTASGLLRRISDLVRLP